MNAMVASADEHTRDRDEGGVLRHEAWQAAGGCGAQQHRATSSFGYPVLNPSDLTKEPMDVPAKKRKIAELWLAAGDGSGEPFGSFSHYSPLRWPGNLVGKYESKK